MKMLILSYTIQQVLLNACTKFQNPMWVVPEKSLTEKQKMHTDRHTDTKSNIVMEKTKTIYPLYTWSAGGIIIVIWTCFK